MAAKSKPHIITWENRSKEATEINRQLTAQLFRVNEMLDVIYKALEDLEARVEALE